MRRLWHYFGGAPVIAASTAAVRSRNTIIASVMSPPHAPRPNARRQAVGLDLDCLRLKLSNDDILACHVFITAYIGMASEPVEGATEMAIKAEWSKPSGVPNRPES
jgi:hypothetical protein